MDTAVWDEKKSVPPMEILVRNRGVTRNVPADDVYYIESSNRKIIVFTKDEKMECYGKIGEWENVLKGSFFRIHKGYLVNMKHVEKYSRTEVQMKNGSSCLISKYKYQDFVKAYQEFISKGSDGKKV